MRYWRKGRTKSVHPYLNEGAANAPLEETMAEKLLELRHISKKFSGVTALEDVSIDIEPGEVLTLVGENGAGK